jgi:hypothetical protein
MPVYHRYFGVSDFTYATRIIESRKTGFKSIYIITFSISMSARRPMTFGIKNVSFYEVFKQKLQRCCHRPSWACTPFFFKFIYLKRRPAEPQPAFIYSKVNNLYICTTLHLCRDSHFCGPFRGDVGTSSDLSPASFLPSY